MKGQSLFSPNVCISVLCTTTYSKSFQNSLKTRLNVAQFVTDVYDGEKPQMTRMKSGTRKTYANSAKWWTNVITGTRTDDENEGIFRPSGFSHAAKTHGA